MYKSLLFLLSFLVLFVSTSSSINAMHIAPQQNVINPYGVSLKTTARDDVYTYVGGNVTGKDYISGSMVTFDPTTDTYRTFNLEGFTTNITDTNIAVSDGSGGWYIGGAFNKYNGVFIDGVGSTGYALIHVNANDAIIGYWLPTSSATSRVMSLTMDGTFLYIGGRFAWTDANSVVHTSIARLNTSTDQLDASFTLTATGTAPYIRTIVFDDTYMYFGGLFTVVNGTTISNKYSNFRVAKSNINVRDTTWGITFTSTTKAFLKMVIVSDGLIVTTNTTVSSYDFIMKVNDTTGALVIWISTSSVSSTSPIYDMLVDGNYLYIAGSLLNISGYTNKDILRLNLSDGTVDTTWIPGTIHDPFITHRGVGLAKVNGVLYGYGSFVTGVEVYKYLITIDLSTGEVSDPASSRKFSFYNNPNPTTHPPAISSSGNTIVVYSEKELSLNVYAKLDKKIARIVTETGVLDDSWGPSISSSITTPIVNKIINLDADSLIILGKFDSIGGVSRTNVAKINKVTGAVDPNFIFDAVSSSSGGVNNGLIVGDNLYIVGFFTAVNGTARLSTAKINLLTNTLDPDWIVDCDDAVYDLAYDNGMLYLAGYFSYIGAVNREALARVSETDGILDDTWVANASNQVKSISIDESGIYIGGNFITINSISTPRFGKLSKLDATVDTDWDYGVSSTVEFVEISDGYVYLAGNMTTVGVLAQPYLARVDKTTGVPDATFNPVVLGIVTTMTKFDDKIVYGVNRSGKLSIYEIPIYYQISHLAENLDVKKPTDGTIVEVGTSYGLNSSLSTVRLAKTDMIVADVVTDMRSDRNWSVVSADSDLSLGKSFAHNITAAPGTSTSYTLYVPKINGDTTVTICPNASSLNEVSLSCPNSVTFGSGETKSVIFPTGSANVTSSTVTISNQDYWALAGVKGTGGVSGSGSVSPTSTPNPSPTPTSISTSTTTSSNQVDIGTVACNSIRPDDIAPWIYSASALDMDSVIINFTDWNSQKDKFVIEYGTKSGNYEFAVDNININSKSYVINGLSKNSRYYFRVRVSNGCAVGPWSNEISVKTKPNSNIGNIVITENNVELVEEFLSDKCDTYTTKKGDTLWGIAEKFHKDGNKYKLIVNKNKSKYPALVNSDTLQTGWKLTMLCDETESEKIDILQTDYKIEIVVRDAKGTLVEDAKVILDNESNYKKTDINGVAIFENLQAGNHVFYIEHNGSKGEETVNLSGVSRNVKLSMVIEQQKFLSNSGGILIGTVSIGLLLLLITLLIYKAKRKSKTPRYVIK